MKKAFFGFTLLIFGVVLAAVAWLVTSGRDFELPAWLATLTGTSSELDINNPPLTEASDLRSNFTSPASLETANSTKNNSSVSLSERITLGRTMLSSGNYLQAATEFAAAGALESRSVEALLGLAEAQIGLNRFDQANANLAAVEKLDATHPRLFILRGEIALTNGDFQTANQLFMNAGATANFQRALMASFFDRGAEAKDLLTQVANGTDPVFAARAKILLDNYAEYESYPDSPKTHLDTLLARSYNQLGEYTLAIAKLRPVLASDPTYRDAWLLLGYAYYARSEYELARSAWGTAYSLDSAKPETQYFLGLAYSALGNYPNAEKYLILAQENGFQPEPELIKKLAEVYFLEEKFELAAKLYYERVSGPEAKIEEFVRGVYLYLEKVRDGKKAWTIASLALQKFPREAQAYNLAGWVSVRNGYLDKARDYLDQALVLDPKLSGAYLNLGEYYEKSDDVENAQASYKKAYELDPSGAVGALAAAAFNRLDE